MRCWHEELQKLRLASAKPAASTCLPTHPPATACKSAQINGSPPFFAGGGEPNVLQYLLERSDTTHHTQCRRTGGIAEYANSTPYRVVAVMCACCGFLSSAVAWSLMKGIDHKVTTTINSSYGGGSGHGSSDGGNNGDGSSSSSSSNTKTTDIAAGALEVLNGKGNGSTDCTDPDNRNNHNSDFGNATTENSSSDASDSIDVRSGGKMKGTPLWTPVFRRFLTMVLLLSGVRTMFRHLDATLPKYITRAFGADAPFGKVYAINPAIIIILVPLLSSLGGGTGGNTAGGGGGGSGGGAGGLKASPSPSRRGVLVRCCRAVPGVAWVTSLHALDSIMLGATVSTCSVLFLVFGGDTHTSLAPAAMFVATLSFGEALWSPQFYSYTYEIAPDGQEGRYFALGNVPLFLPKLLAGILSGWALEEHCTVEDCSEGSKLWGLIFWSVAPFTAANIVLRVVGFLHK